MYELALFVVFSSSFSFSGVSRDAAPHAGRRQAPVHSERGADAAIAARLLGRGGHARAAVASERAAIHGHRSTA